MKRINRLSVLVSILFVSCTSLNISKNSEIGNQILITQYSGFILSKILEIEFENKNEKSQNFQLENIQIVFFNEDNSALVYLGSINFINVVNYNETLEDANVKYSDWKGVIVEANIVACYEYSDLNLEKEQIRTEVFKLKNREIVNVNQFEGRE